MRLITQAARGPTYPDCVSHLIELFHSAHCVSCPLARAVLQQLAARRSDITIVEHDIDHLDALALAKSYQLIATPALVIDRDSVMYGVPRLEKLRERIEASAPAVS